MANQKTLELNEVFWCNWCQKQTAFVFVGLLKRKSGRKIYNEYKCLECNHTKTIVGETPKSSEFVFR